MNKLLKRFNLIDSFSVELNNSDDVTKYLNDITGQLGLLSFDDKEFEGVIRNDKFQIQSKATLFSTVTWAAAYGHIIKSSDKIIVNVDVRARYRYFLIMNFIIFSFLFIFVGLPISIGEFLKGDYQDGFIAIIFFGLLFSFGVLYPMWRMRWGVLNLRYDLEQGLIKLRRKQRQT